MRDGALVTTAVLLRQRQGTAPRPALDPAHRCPGAVAQSRPGRMAGVHLSEAVLLGGIGDLPYRAFLAVVLPWLWLPKWRAA